MIIFSKFSFGHSSLEVNDLETESKSFHHMNAHIDNKILNIPDNRLNQILSECLWFLSSFWLFLLPFSLWNMKKKKKSKRLDFLLLEVVIQDKEVC